MRAYSVTEADLGRPGTGHFLLVMVTCRLAVLRPDCSFCWQWRGPGGEPDVDIAEPAAGTKAVAGDATNMQLVLLWLWHCAIELSRWRNATRLAGA